MEQVHYMPLEKRGITMCLSVQPVVDDQFLCRAVEEVEKIEAVGELLEVQTSGAGGYVTAEDSESHTVLQNYP